MPATMNGVYESNVTTVHHGGSPTKPSVTLEVVSDHNTSPPQGLGGVGGHPHFHHPPHHSPPIGVPPPGVQQPLHIPAKRLGPSGVWAPAGGYNNGGLGGVDPTGATSLFSPTLPAAATAAGGGTGSGAESGSPNSITNNNYAVGARGEPAAVPPPPVSTTPPPPPPPSSSSYPPTSHYSSLAATEAAE